MGSVICIFCQNASTLASLKGTGEEEERERGSHLRTRYTRIIIIPKVEETREEDDSDTSGTPNISCK